MSVNSAADVCGRSHCSRKWTRIRAGAGMRGTNYQHARTSRLQHGAAPQLPQSSRHICAWVSVPQCCALPLSNNARRQITIEETVKLCDPRVNMCLLDRARARCSLFCSSCIPTILIAWLSRALCSWSPAAAKASLGVAEGRGDVVERPRAIVGLEDAPGGAPLFQVWLVIFPTAKGVG